MKHLLSFMQFVNEADAPKPPAPQPPTEDEDEVANKPTTITPPATTPPADGTAATPGTPATAPVTPAADGTGAAGDIPDASAADPAADASTDAGGAAGADASSGGSAAGGAAGGSSDASSTAGTSDAGGVGAPPSSSGSAGSSSSGASLGDPLSDEDTETPPKPGIDQPKTEKPEDYVPPVSRFNLVFMDKNAKWEQEYPDGGGVKDMAGYEVSWKDLNKWIDQNKFGAKKKDIAEYLMGENDDLDADVKAKLKSAFNSKTLGDDTGSTEVEFDNDLTPYVQDINTIIVDL